MTSLGSSELPIPGSDTPTGARGVVSGQIEQGKRWLAVTRAQKCTGLIIL